MNVGWILNKLQRRRQRVHRFLGKVDGNNDLLLG